VKEERKKTSENFSSGWTDEEGGGADGDSAHNSSLD
jgi:hypothetical protein